MSWKLTICLLSSQGDFLLSADKKQTPFFSPILERRKEKRQNDDQ